MSLVMLAGQTDCAVVDLRGKTGRWLPDCLEPRSKSRQNIRAAALGSTAYLVDRQRAPVGRLRCHCSYFCDMEKGETFASCRLNVESRGHGSSQGS